MGSRFRLFKTSDSPGLKQTWTMSAVLINMVAQGMVLAYPSSLLTALMATDSPIKIEVETASSLAQLTAFLAMPGFLISSLLMHFCGRKISYAVLLVPAVVGWLCMYFASNVACLFVGRFLCGFTTHATITMGTFIIAEFASPENRGTFIAFNGSFMCLGVMISHFLTSFISWKTQALVSIIPLLISFGIILTWPESPYWLLTKRRSEKCESSFYYLRGRGINSRKELEATILAQQYIMSLQEQTISCFDKFGKFMEKFAQKEFLKPMLIMMLATLVLESSGRHYLPTYEWYTFRSVTRGLDSRFSALGPDVIITASSFFGSMIILIANRRTLLLYTGFTSFFILVLIALCNALVSYDVLSRDQDLIAVFLSGAYTLLSNLGIGTVPYILIAEIFPLAHRSTGLAMTGVWTTVCLSAAVRYMPLMFENMHWFLAICAVVMGISLSILYFVMPETKDKTLQEIENYFRYGHYEARENVENEENVEMISDRDNNKPTSISE